MYSNILIMFIIYSLSLFEWHIFLFFLSVIDCYLYSYNFVIKVISDHVYGCFFPLSIKLTNWKSLNIFNQLERYLFVGSSRDYLVYQICNYFVYIENTLRKKNLKNELSIKNYLITAFKKPVISFFYLINIKIILDLILETTWSAVLWRGGPCRVLYLVSFKSIFLLHFHRGLNHKLWRSSS